MTCAFVAFAEDVDPQRDPVEEVLGPLKRVLAWYQQARIAMQSANDAMGGLIVREDEQSLLRVVQRAFDVARAQAVLVERSGTTTAASSAPTTSPAERRAQAEAAVRDTEREVARLQELIRPASRARRAALERDLVAAERTLALERQRLEFIKSLEQANVSLTSGDQDLAHQIQALQDAVPELNPGTAPAKTVVAAAPTPPTSGWPVVHELLALQRVRNALAQLDQRTQGLAREVDRSLDATEKEVRDLAQRLRTLTRNVGTGTAAAPLDDREFRAELDRLKALSAVLLSTRAQSAALHRFASDVDRWQRAQERETRRALEELAMQLAGVAVTLLAIFIGGMLWRVATMRYIGDPYRRRLSLTARNVVVITAIVLVIIFRFTTELTALVTALGFAAAGIAFALQNVILSLAGYFSMVGPNGIRLGDRVSLQGPFGYVQGEVIEIGFLRLRLRELSGDGLQPTGRTVVFPNSVVFTGTFFKLPSAPHARAA